MNCVCLKESSAESLIFAQKQISDLTRKLTDFEEILDVSRRENAKLQDQIFKLQSDLKEVCHLKFLNI